VPTYNRAGMLEDLYKSLISQNHSNSELIIVNDGSTDKTENLIKGWINDSKVNIKYLYQNNAGRALALRKALLNAEGLYTIIMDDDDYFVGNGLLKVKNSLIEIKDSENTTSELAGVCCLCVSEHGDILGNRFPNNGYSTDFFTMRFLDKLSGDKKEIVKTSILKENIFPNFPNEKRVVTSTLWNRIAYNYRCVCLNYPIAIKRYIKGGMSDSLIRLKAESPNYQIEDCIIAINYPNSYRLSIIIRHSVILWKYWGFGGQLSLNRIKNSRLIVVFFCLPLGIILFIRDWIKLNILNNGL